MVFSVTSSVLAVKQQHCLFHVEKAVMASATQSASHVPHVMLRQPTLIHLVGPL